MKAGAMPERTKDKGRGGKEEVTEERKRRDDTIAAVTPQGEERTVPVMGNEIVCGGDGGEIGADAEQQETGKDASDGALVTKECQGEAIKEEVGFEDGHKTEQTELTKKDASTAAAGGGGWGWGGWNSLWSSVSTVTESAQVALQISPSILQEVFPVP